MIKFLRVLSGCESLSDEFLLFILSHSVHNIHYLSDASAEWFKVSNNSIIITHRNTMTVSCDWARLLTGGIASSNTRACLSSLTTQTTANTENLVCNSSVNIKRHIENTVIENPWKVIRSNKKLSDEFYPTRIRNSISVHPQYIDQRYRCFK